MRRVSIFHSDGTAVTTDCIQTGTTGISRKSNSIFYEMSDGTCVCYPSQTARADMMLTLECNQAQADAIDAASHCGLLLFEGIRFAAKNVTAATEKYRAFIAGTIQIEEKFCKSGIYSVMIPLRFDVCEETYRTGVV